MTCVVECYNPALAPSSAAITIPESLREKLGVAAPETLFMSPRALHSLSQDLCSSEHSLHSSSSSTVQEVARSTPPQASIATRAEPSSLSRTISERHSQLGRPSAEIAAHIHTSMRQREAALPSLQLASPQLHKRCYIVDFLQGACEMLQLTRNTRFLAMLLVDHFMDKHIVMEYRLKLVALTCLMVSAKFEEHEDHMVCMEQLQIMAQQCGENPEHYTKQEFLMMELYLLKFFEWSVSHPTAVHFAEYFLSAEDVEIEEEEPSRYSPSGSPSVSQQDEGEMKAQVDRMTSCFLEASLRETSFLQYPHSLVAAAALCASRICLGLPTAWNNKLGTLTQYDLGMMSVAVDHLLKLFYYDCDA